MQTEPYNAASHPPDQTKDQNSAILERHKRGRGVWSSKAGNAEEEKQKEVLLPPMPTGWFIPNDDGSDDCHCVSVPAISRDTLLEPPCIKK